MANLSHWPLWFERFAIHQDYVWFVVLLGWGFTALLWWRRAARERAWDWVPWAAAAGALGAVVQFGIFNPHLDIFQSRLKPGTIRDFVPAAIDVELLGDWLLAALAAGWAIAWSWLALRERASAWRVGFSASVVAAAGVHVFAPRIGSVALAAAVLLPALALARGRSRAGQLALLLAAAGPLFSTIGPVAAATGELQRVGPPTAFGLVAALYQCLAAALVFFVVRRESPRRAAATAHDRIPRGWWALAAAWLAGGLWFAQEVGWDNRHELHQNRLRGAAARAQVIRSDLLERWAQPLPPLWRPGADGDATRMLPGCFADLTDALSQLVAREFRFTPFVERVRIVVVNSGWVFVLADSRRHLPDGVVEVLRRATPPDEADWAAARNLIEVSPVPEIGRPYFCRAAMVAADGRMLGWLEFEQREFFQSIERKWRSGPLLVTALGLLLGATLVLQRRVDREREAAERDAAVQTEASRVKSAFLATVSHELRTPLQSLLGYGELLRARVESDAQSAAWLDAMRQHGELMTRLVNDLIDLGAIDAGTLRLAPRVVAPGQLVLGVVEGLRPRAEAKGLRLQCVVDASVPTAVRLDDARWRQVVFNLVGNAVKFTDRGAVDVRLRAEPRGGVVALLLEVVDTGPGIAPDAQRTLFQAFARLARTAHQEGAGIGLALSAALCRALDGTLTVESDGVHGSTFRASVLGEPAELAGETRGIAPRSLAGKHVLVVDDNALVRELFAAMLTSAGARVALAATSAAASAAAEDRSVAVAVLDFALGSESGLDLAAQLRQLRPELRLIGASAHAGAAEREAALRAGFERFLTKPVAQAELLAAVAGGGDAPLATTTALLPAWQEELARQFRREAPQNRRTLAQAVVTREWIAARGAAHYLANSAAAVGDAALRDACEAVVRAAEQRDEAALRAGWVAIEAALGRWVRAE
ncbi:MAG: response regulator [Opitutae bacterium]|nr:response regulator [Opitutae bacterium]